MIIFFNSHPIIQGKGESNWRNNKDTLQINEGITEKGQKKVQYASYTSAFLSLNYLATIYSFLQCSCQKGKPIASDIFEFLRKWTPKLNPCIKVKMTRKMPNFLVLFQEKDIELFIRILFSQKKNFYSLVLHGS